MVTLREKLKKRIAKLKEKKPEKSLEDLKKELKEQKEQIEKQKLSMELRESKKLVKQEVERIKFQKKNPRLVKALRKAQAVKRTAVKGAVRGGLRTTSALRKFEKSRKPTTLKQFVRTATRKKNGRVVSRRTPKRKARRKRTSVRRPRRTTSQAQTFTGFPTLDFDF